MHHHPTSTATTPNTPREWTYQTHRYTTPCGHLDVTINDHHIVQSHYILHTWPTPHPTTHAPRQLTTSPALSDSQQRLVDDIGRQLDNYFNGTTRTFDLPLCTDDDVSEFTHTVRQEMMRIPPGAVITYGDLAAAAGRPRAARAVGTVCRTNPIQLFIPCHRVIASGGSLGGYMGDARGLSLKQQLLDNEGIPFTPHGKVDLRQLAYNPMTTLN
ncbi:methylated-DNA--[protein]-cysteine S-methyltransferase [Corynebacterium kroppenstedtii]|uniref:methylated-DNA--[protein]-cysteine S-methyltransferase n=1 Tax=Corynebacterium sp. PCR 32 TaxID=3351342 RepID=UPI0030B4A785